MKALILSISSVAASAGLIGTLPDTSTENIPTAAAEVKEEYDNSHELLGTLSQKIHSCSDEINLTTESIGGYGLSAENIINFQVGVSRELFALQSRLNIYETRLQELQDEFTEISGSLVVTKDFNAETTERVNSLVAEMAVNYYAGLEIRCRLGGCSDTERMQAVKEAVGWFEEMKEDLAGKIAFTETVSEIERFQEDLSFKGLAAQMIADENILRTKLDTCHYLSSDEKDFYVAVVYYTHALGAVDASKASSEVRGEFEASMPVIAKDLRNMTPLDPRAPLIAEGGMMLREIARGYYKGDSISEPGYIIPSESSYDNRCPDRQKKSILEKAVDYLIKEINKAAKKKPHGLPQKPSSLKDKVKQKIKNIFTNKGNMIIGEGIKAVALRPRISSNPDKYELEILRKEKLTAEAACNYNKEVEKAIEKRRQSSVSYGSDGTCYSGQRHHHERDYGRRGSNQGSSGGSPGNGSSGGSGSNSNSGGGAGASGGPKCRDVGGGAKLCM